MSAADTLPYDPGPALTRREVVQELVGLGFAPEEAPRMVAGYLDETSARVGVRVDNWALDIADVDAIADAYRSPGDRGEAGAVVTAGDDTGDGTGADVGDVDAAIACAAAAAAAAEVAVRANAREVAGDLGGAGVVAVADVNGADVACDEDGQR